MAVSLSNQFFCGYFTKLVQLQRLQVYRWLVSICVFQRGWLGIWFSGGVLSTRDKDSKYTRAQEFLAIASVGGNVLHEIGLPTRARNLGTRFTFLISFGQNHNRPTPNTYTEIPTAG